MRRRRGYGPFCTRNLREFCCKTCLVLTTGNVYFRGFKWPRHMIRRERHGKVKMFHMGVGNFSILTPVVVDQVREVSSLFVLYDL